MKWKLTTKAKWMADHAAFFDRSAFKSDQKRRDAFLKCAEKFFDREAANSWDGQFNTSGRSSTDDGSARLQYLQEIENLKTGISGSPEDSERPPGRSSELSSVFGVGMGLILLAATLYVYRDDVSKVANPFVARLVPSQGYSTDPQSVRYLVDPRGQFGIDARANGIWFRFMFDTGASSIVFSKADARRLGFDPEVLRFDRTIWTANGRARAAAIQLRTLEIGPIVVTDIQALIDDGDLREPLLGMEFLKRMSGVEIKNGTLTIRR